MIARASSGSRSRISSIEPLTSANSAVPVLRSPSSASGELPSGATHTREDALCGVEVATSPPAPFVSGAPPLPQKSDVGGFSALHFAQCFASAFPHFAQKLFVEGLFVPHFEQRIDAPREPGNRPLLYHPTSATDQQATEGRWQYVPLPSKAVGDRRWRGYSDAR